MSVATAAENAAHAGKYLTFAVSGERYGIAILNVQEIIGVVKITPVPRSATFIRGVINLRGKIIPVMDIRTRFGLQPIAYDERTCIIVTNLNVNGQNVALGMIVDTVLEVINFAAGDIEPAPNYGGDLNTNFVLGIGKREGLINILVDSQKILNANEKKELAAEGSK